jgi:predicted ATPase
MNEQLVVKNFGPIKDATVDFKRVTVFIGPTGGGKSTLAKLAAICQDGKFTINEISNRKDLLKNYGLDNYIKLQTSFTWKDEDGEIRIDAALGFDAEPRRSRSLERFIAKAKNGSSSLAKEFTEKVNAYAKAIEKTDVHLRTCLGIG